MPLANTQAEDFLLPHLRQDLRLLPGTPERNGKPSWLLYDPLRNTYFKLGRRGVNVLRHWQPGKTFPSLLQSLKATGLEIEQEEVATLHNFLRGNELLAASSPDGVNRLVAKNGEGRQSLLKRVLKDHLFFRIPLFKPDPFLEKTLPYVLPLFGRWVWLVFILFGLCGLFLATRQWAEFTSTFLYFFDLPGLLIFGLTTIIVKTAHELGHAYTAKRYGVKIPTMGIAFMVLYPMLYTDTTDAWRLQSHRQRMYIAMAGVKVELAIGMLALFTWGFLGDGMIRSAVWFLAAVSWASSLVINLSPFMRFDGYYMLADWLGEENLQPRSFNMARWHLRKQLFGINDPVPESLPRFRHNFFILYAWAVWIYRFFLFIGIALMLYHLAFKALGMLLFIIELFWFIVLPFWREITMWWHRREDMRGSVRPAATLVLFALVCLLFFIPWQSRMVLPAVWKASKHSAIHPPEEGRLAEVMVENGQHVLGGQPLFRIEQDHLQDELQLIEIDEILLKTLINRHPGSASELKSILVLKNRLIELQAKRTALLEKEQILLFKAPFDGIVEMGNNPIIGEWMNQEKVILSLTKPGKGKVHAYVSEAELYRIVHGQAGHFIAGEAERSAIKVKLDGISRAAVNSIEDPVLASSYGGPIAVRGGVDGILRPEQGLYKLNFTVENDQVSCEWITSGVVVVKCRSASLIKRFYQSSVSVLIREFSF